MLDDSDDLDERAPCVDCDAIVNELRKLRRRRGDMSVPEELRRANELLAESLAMWLSIHRREKEHPLRNEDDDGKVAVGGPTFGIPA